MRSLCILLFASTLVAGAACTKPVQRCETDDQCPKGQTCSQGVCTAPCSSGCGDGGVCDNAKCYPKDCGGVTCPPNAFCDGDSCVYHGCHLAQCPATQTCVTGGVCVTTQCGANACASNFYCAGSTCTDSSCYGIDCPAGQVCSDAKCHSTDCGGRSCGASFCADGVYCKDCPNKKCDDTILDECIEGSCQSSDCLSDPSSSTCTNACKKAGHICTTSQVCIGATCALKNCPSHTCLPGSYCDGWSCVPDACVAVTCTEGQRCAGDGNCYPTDCSGAACPDGQVCSAGKCTSALCLGVPCSPPGTQCWAGSCYSTTGPDGKPCPTGQLNIAGACRPAGSVVDCGGVACPSGFACQAGACADQGCLDLAAPCKASEGCLGGVCYPTSDPVNGPCDEGQLFVDGECRDANGDKPILCGAAYCAAGFLCEDSRCVDARCLGVECSLGEECADGACASVTAPDGGSCPPGTVWSTDGCKAQPPISGCAEGCVPDTNGFCVPPGCVNGGCGQICGDPSCYTFCTSDQACDRDGVCHSLCSACPTGFVCSDGQSPPCLPQTCLSVACPDGMHCIDVGSGPTCEPVSCGLETECEKDQYCRGGTCVAMNCPTCKAGQAPGSCSAVTCPSGTHCVDIGGGPACESTSCSEETSCLPNEYCDNGTCVDMSCAAAKCTADQTCLVGKCYPRCCPDSGECSDDTVGYTFSGPPPYCETLKRNCDTMLCPTDEVCWGGACGMPNPSIDCTSYGPEPLYCDGKDNDCNGHVDDYVFYPRASTNFAVFPSWDSTDPYLVDREPCTNTFGDNYEDDWSVIGAFGDGYDVYLMRLDKDRPSPSDPWPATHVANSGPAGMSSCIQVDMPCARFMATTMNLRIHGTGAVSCARDVTDNVTCGGTCLAPYVHIYVRDVAGHAWKDISNKSDPNSLGFWFRPALDVAKPVAERLSDKHGNPRQVQSVLICRDMRSSQYASVSIDGINLVGCCRH